MKTKFTQFIFGLASTLLLFNGQARAFSLSPMVASLLPRGPRSTRIFRVRNTGAGRIALQVQVFHAEVDQEGREERIPTDEFAITPRDFVLGPGEGASIRLTWKGQQTPPRELAYRVVVAEVGMASGRPAPRRLGVDLNPLTQYFASVYVRPPGASPHFSMDSFKLLPDGRGELILSNSGTAHCALKGLRLFIKKPTEGRSPERYELQTVQLNELRTETLLPGSIRRFVLELPESLSDYAGPLSAEVSFN